MTFLDAGVLIILLVFLVRGVWIGLARQLASLAGLFLGFAAAGRYYQQVGGFLDAYVPSPQVGFLITYGLLFLLVYLMTIALGIGLKKVMNISFLSWFDRLMGGVFGASKAVLLATVLFMALAGFLSASSPLLTRSFFAPYLETSSRFFLTFVKDKKLRSRFLPKDPAISALLPLPAPAVKPVGGDAKKGAQ